MNSKFMKLALEEAYNGINSSHGGPFGAVIVKDGEIIGRGHNRVLLNNDPTAHGEIMAIRNACENIHSFKLKGCEIYTTAEPCPMCLGAILWAEIEKVYYGCSVSDTENIGFADSKFYDIMKNGKESFSTQCCVQDCQKLFDDYMNIQGKKPY